MLLVLLIIAIIAGVAWYFGKQRAEQSQQAINPNIPDIIKCDCGSVRMKRIECIECSRPNIECLECRQQLWSCCCEQSKGFDPEQPRQSSPRLNQTNPGLPGIQQTNQQTEFVEAHAGSHELNETQENLSVSKTPQLTSMNSLLSEDMDIANNVLGAYENARKSFHSTNRLMNETMATNHETTATNQETIATNQDIIKCECGCERVVIGQCTGCDQQTLSGDIFCLECGKRLLSCGNGHAQLSMIKNLESTQKQIEEQLLESMASRRSSHWTKEQQITDPPESIKSRRPSHWTSKNVNQQIQSWQRQYDVLTGNLRTQLNMEINQSTPSEDRKSRSTRKISEILTKSRQLSDTEPSPETRRSSNSRGNVNCSELNDGNDAMSKSRKQSKILRKSRKVSDAEANGTSRKSTDTMDTTKSREMKPKNQSESNTASDQTEQSMSVISRGESSKGSSVIKGWQESRSSKQSTILSGEAQPWERTWNEAMKMKEDMKLGDTQKSDLSELRRNSRDMRKTSHSTNMILRKKLHRQRELTELKNPNHNKKDREFGATENQKSAARKRDKQYDITETMQPIKSRQPSFIATKKMLQEMIQNEELAKLENRDETRKTGVSRSNENGSHGSHSTLSTASSHRNDSNGSHTGDYRTNSHKSSKSRNKSRRHSTPIAIKCPCGSQRVINGQCTGCNQQTAGCLKCGRRLLLCGCSQGQQERATKMAPEKAELERINGVTEDVMKAAVKKKNSKWNRIIGVQENVIFEGEQSQLVRDHEPNKDAKSEVNDEIRSNREERKQRMCTFYQGNQNQYTSVTPKTDTYNRINEVLSKARGVREICGVSLEDIRSEQRLRHRRNPEYRRDLDEFLENSCQLNQRRTMLQQSMFHRPRYI